MFIDARRVASGTVVDADVCVIGCGAAGITIAKELDASGYRVAILEAGNFEFDAAFERKDFEFDIQGESIRSDIPTRRIQFGGATNAWFGRIAKFDPIDLEHRDWVPNSGWPLTSYTLKRYYGRAADILGVPHHAQMEADAWRQNPTFQAFNQHDLTTGAFFWAEKYLMGPVYQQQLARSSNVTVYLNAQVQALESQFGERVTHVAVRAGQDTQLTVRAQHYVLATGGHENARLLLLSRNQVAAGLGNHHDNVGRYLVDHPRCEGLAHIELANSFPETIARVASLGEKARSPYGPVQLHVKFSAEAQRREKLLNHCVHAYLINAGQELEGWNALRQLLTGRISAGSRSLGQMLSAIVSDLPGLMQYGPALAMGKAPLKYVALVDQMEQEPTRDSRVYLSERKVDSHGKPLLAVDWRVSEATQRSRVRLHEALLAQVTALRLGSLHSHALNPDLPTPRFLDMKHPAGTTRMSASPVNGVVDRDCRVFGVANLSVVGTSVMPTIGHANPTFAIVALSIRLADSLKQSLQAPTIRQTASASRSS